jgi:hypothetical protein
MAGVAEAGFARAAAAALRLAAGPGSASGAHARPILRLNERSAPGTLSAVTDMPELGGYTLGLW